MCSAKSKSLFLRDKGRMDAGGGDQPSLSRTVTSVHIPKGAWIAFSTFFVIHYHFYWRPRWLLYLSVWMCLIPGWLLKCPAMVGSVGPEVHAGVPKTSILSHLSLTLSLHRSLSFCLCSYVGLSWTIAKARGSFRCSHARWEPRYSGKHFFHLLLDFSNLSLESCCLPHKK